MISLKDNEPFIIVNGRCQLLSYYSKETQRSFHISTAAKGFGETHGSYKTPRGWHYIRAIIGKELPIDTYYKSRRAVGTITSISGRILWLCGLEAHNHHASNHSMRRYIYIHGTPQHFLKKPISEGCINMRNSDIKLLTDIIPPYCKVYIDSGE